MSQTLTLTTQQLPEQVGTLSAGDRVLLSGTIYTARDAAHKRLFQLLDEGRPLPFHRLLDLGLTAMIGKGERSQPVIDAIMRNKACYFAAVGGAGALIAKCIQTSEVIAFDDLGCESIKRMTVENFPLTVAIDSQGNDLFRTGRAEYRRIDPAESGN